MKHECQNITLQLSLPWFFGVPFRNGFQIRFQRVSLSFLDRSLSILQLNQDQNLCVRK